MEIDAQKINPKDVTEDFKSLQKCCMLKNKWMDAEGNMKEKAFVEKLADHSKEKMSGTIFILFEFLIFLAFFYQIFSCFSQRNKVILAKMLFSSIISNQLFANTAKHFWSIFGNEYNHIYIIRLV